MEQEDAVVAEPSGEAPPAALSVAQIVSAMEVAL
jgi:hypothetical protein